MSESDAHIQDAEILKISKQEQHETKPLIRFACVLPSGRELHSEWLDPGKRREAVQAWLAAVRAEIVADEEEVRLKARRKVLEAKAAKETASQDTQQSPPIHSAPSVTTPSSMTSAGISATRAGQSSSSAPSAPFLSTDPNLFVRQAVSQAEQTVAYWRAEATKATALWQEAEVQLKKWRGIAHSIGVPTGAESTAANSPDRTTDSEPSSERMAAEQPNSTDNAGALSDASSVREI